jgi:hypothetical protein
MQKNKKEEDVFEVRVQPLIKMQTSTKVQPNVMEINMSALGVIEARRCATIMDITTLLDKDIHIPDLDQFMWI